MGRIEADRLPKWPDLGQGQTLYNQLSNVISAQILSIEPQDQHQPIHRVPGSMTN